MYKAGNSDGGKTYKRYFFNRPLDNKDSFTRSAGRRRAADAKAATPKESLAAALAKQRMAKY